MKQDSLNKWLLRSSFEINARILLLHFNGPFSSPGPRWSCVCSCTHCSSCVDLTCSRWLTREIASERLSLQLWTARAPLASTNEGALCKPRCRLFSLHAWAQSHFHFSCLARTHADLQPTNNKPPIRAAWSVGDTHVCTWTCRKHWAAVCFTPDVDQSRLIHTAFSVITQSAHWTLDRVCAVGAF